MNVQVKTRAMAENKAFLQRYVGAGESRLTETNIKL
jgi:hypothetical protein